MARNWSTCSDLILRNFAKTLSGAGIPITNIIHLHSYRNKIFVGLRCTVAKVFHRICSNFAYAVNSYADHDYQYNFAKGCALQKLQFHQSANPFRYWENSRYTLIREFISLECTMLIGICQCLRGTLATTLKHVGNNNMFPGISRVFAQFHYWIRSIVFRSLEIRRNFKDLSGCCL